MEQVAWPVGDPHPREVRVRVCVCVRARARATCVCVCMCDVQMFARARVRPRALLAGAPRVSDRHRDSFYWLRYLCLRLENAPLVPDRPHRLRTVI